MLNIPFSKLMGTCQQQMRPERARLTIDQGHGILQLIAIAEGSARLIESRSGPHATG